MSGVEAGYDVRPAVGRGPRASAGPEGLGKRGGEGGSDESLGKKGSWTEGRDLVNGLVRVNRAVVILETPPVPNCVVRRGQADRLGGSQGGGGDVKHDHSPPVCASQPPADVCQIIDERVKRICVPVERMGGVHMVSGVTLRTHGSDERRRAQNI